MPKDREPASLTLEECQAMLAAAPERKGRFGRRRKAEAPAVAAEPATGAKVAKPRARKKPAVTEAAATGPAKPAKSKAAKKKKSRVRGAPPEDPAAGG